MNDADKRIEIATKGHETAQAYSMKNAYERFKKAILD